LIQAALFSLSVGDSRIRPSRTLPRYSHVWLALQLAKYSLALSQLAFYPYPAVHGVGKYYVGVSVVITGVGLGLGLWMWLGLGLLSRADAPT